jgi:DNA polymerase delta subunit 1
MSERITADYPPPVALEFEKVLWKCILISPKKYAGFLLDTKTLQPILDPEKMVTKGIVIARRDNCKLLRRMYGKVLHMCLTDVSLDDIMKYVLQELYKLMDGKIPIDDLIIIKAVRKAYKSESNPMNIFSGYLKEKGKIINPGDRLEYIYVETENPYCLQGYKMQAPEFHEEDGTKVDTLYYVEKQLVKPIDQLLKVSFQEELDGKGPKNLPMARTLEHLREKYSGNEEKEDRCEHSIQMRKKKLFIRESED